MIRRSLTLKATPDRAFTAWTRDIHLWWPPSHTRHRGRVELSPDAFVERWEGGVRDIGKVVEWSPPDRLVYDFYPGSGPDRPTRVSITFAASETGTRVDIEHVRHTVPAEQFERSAKGYRPAWDEILHSITRHLESP